MSNWYVEHRSVDSSPELATDIARHIHLRSALGPSVVIVHNASRFLSVMRKRWVLQEKWIQREISSTLDKNKLSALNEELERMRALTFASSKSLDETRPPDVLMLAPNELTSLPKSYDTLYITTVLDEKAREKILSRLTRHGLLVDYDSTTKALMEK